MRSLPRCLSVLFSRLTKDFSSFASLRMYPRYSASQWDVSGFRFRHPDAVFRRRQKSFFSSVSASISLFCQRLFRRDHDFCFSFPALSAGQLKSVQCRSQLVRGIMIHPLTPVGLTEDSPRSFHVFSIFEFHGGWQDSIPCLRPC